MVSPDEVKALVDNSLDAPEDQQNEPAQLWARPYNAETDAGQDKAGRFIDPSLGTALASLTHKAVASVVVEVQGKVHTIVKGSDQAKLIVKFGRDTRMPIAREPRMGLLVPAREGGNRLGDIQLPADLVEQIELVQHDTRIIGLGLVDDEGVPIGAIGTAVGHVPKGIKGPKGNKLKLIDGQEQGFDPTVEGVSRKIDTWLAAAPGATKLPLTPTQQALLGATHKAEVERRAAA